MSAKVQHGLSVKVADATGIVGRLVESGVPQAMANAAGRVLRNIEVVNVRGPAAMAEALRRGAANVAVVPRVDLPELVRTGVLANLSCASDALLANEDTRPITIDGRILGVMAPSLTDAVVVLAPGAVNLDIEGGTAAMFDTLRCILVWLALLNGCSWDIAGPTDFTTECTEVATYTIQNLVRVNCDIVDIVWTKLAPATAPVPFRTASRSNPGPITPQRTDGTDAYSHECRNDGREFRTPMCTEGGHTITCTVSWRCDLDGKVHQATKQLVVKATPPPK